MGTGPFQSSSEYVGQNKKALAFLDPLEDSCRSDHFVRLRMD
jgi:hypothetical protein